MDGVQRYGIDPMSGEGGSNTNSGGRQVGMAPVGILTDPCIHKPAVKVKPAAMTPAQIRMAHARAAKKTRA